MAGEAMMRADVGEVNISPAEAQLYPVHRTAALAWYYRQGMARMQEGSAAWVWWADRERDALADLARFSKLANDAGVADRLLWMARVAAEKISAAFDDVLEPLDLKPEARAQLVADMAARLTLLEQGDDEPIEGEKS
jgi:hypothetical protein